MPESIQGQFTDVLIVTELRGSYPNVPIAVDVDYDALIANDATPTFLTLPIAKVNATSGNRRYYDDAFVTELMRQTIAQKPIGLMGHMTEAERATAFLPEALHWVGAVRDGDLVWGKAYIVPGPVRERIARYKASGKSIATSIDAQADGKWDESLKAYRMDAATLRLGQIDLAPSDRAGIGDLARIPMLTSEMTQEVTEVLDTKENPEMDRTQIIQELTSADIPLLPANVRSAILEAATPPPEVAQISELRTALGVDDKTDLTKLVTELRTEQAAARRAAVTSRITELVASGIKVGAVRQVVQELVQAQNPTTVQEAEDAYKRVSEMESVKALLSAKVQETMGPRQGVPVQGQNAQNAAPKFYSIPEKEAN
jgi:hypothetical protein